MAVEDLLERDLAVELGVEGHEDRTQAPSSVGPEDAEPLAVAGGSPRRRRCRFGSASSFSVAPEPLAAWPRVASIVGIADLREARPKGRARVERRQALFGVVAVAMEVLDGKPLKQVSFVRVDHPLSGQDIGDPTRLVAGPGSKGENQHILVDQPVLQGEQPDEQVTVRGVAACP